MAITKYLHYYETALFSHHYTTVILCRLLFYTKKPMPVPYTTYILNNC
jgi:hypothetical protein